MLILFDHGTSAPLLSFLKDHSIKETDMGWDTLSNGELLDVAEKQDSKCCSRQIKHSLSAEPLQAQNRAGSAGEPKMASSAPLRSEGYRCCKCSGTRKLYRSADTQAVTCVIYFIALTQIPAALLSADIRRSANVPTNRVLSNQAPLITFPVTIEKYLPAKLIEVLPSLS